MLSDLTQHPFQSFRIEDFPYCEGVKFDDRQNAAFEDYVRDLELAFEKTANGASYWHFISKYVDVSNEMLKRTGNPKIMRPVLENALVRLVVILNHLRKRGRTYFSEPNSVHVFNFDVSMLADARKQADEMERSGVTNMPYDLKRSPEIMAWARQTLQPMIEKYIGSKVVLPGAEIRFAETKGHADKWEDAYRHHAYGNYHLDQSCYAFPLIIYLDDVDENDGPFSYVEGSDKYRQNFVLRAFHQALTFHCHVGGLKDEDFILLGTLPSVFRGGDLVGAFAGPAPFERHQVVNFIGPAGKAVLFQGFHLVHSGGHPRQGKRKSFFINYRYPNFKMSETLGKAAALYWRNRTRNT